MCWVIPPRSPAATVVERMASRRLGLPWSTWPRTVTSGALRPRVPLLLLATAASDHRRTGHSGQELGPEAGGNLRLEGPLEEPPIDGARDAGLVATDVRATAVRPAARIDAHDAVGRANDTQ